MFLSVSGIIQVTIFLLLFANEGCEGETILLELNQDSHNEDRVVPVSSNVNITCSFNVTAESVNSGRIRWDVGQYFDDKSRQRKSTLSRLTVGSTTIDGTILTSSVSLRDVQTTDTGYFDCVFENGGQIPIVLRQYIFIDDDDEYHLLVNSKLLRLTLGAENQLIGCKPSQPDVTVKLYRLQDRFQQQIRREITVGKPDSNWSYDIHQGYTIGRITAAEAGLFQCEATNLGQNGYGPVRANISISVIGATLTSWDSTVVQGENATLACRLFGLSGSRAEWLIRFSNGIEINGSTVTSFQLPEGMEAQVVHKEDFEFPESAVSILILSNVTLDMTIKCHGRNPSNSIEVYQSDVIAVTVIDPITGNQEGHNISGLVGHSLAGRLSPPGDHQVIESGSSFDISCSYGTVGYSAYHRWVPARQFSLLAKEELSMERFQIIRAVGLDDGKDLVTLTVNNSVVSDTGYYTCILDLDPPVMTKRYVFVHEPNTVSLVTSDVAANIAPKSQPMHIVYRIRLGDTILISCRPTHPEVEVTFFKDDNFDQKHYTPIDVERDNRWHYDPFEGMTLRNATRMDNGTYDCVGERGGLTSKIRFSVLTSGVVVRHWRSPPAEDDNVTLVCDSFRLGTIKPEWFVTYENAPLELRLDPKALPHGMDIKMRFDQPGETYTSNLTINGATAGVSGVYRCQVASNKPHPNVQAHSSSISLRFKGGRLKEDGLSSSSQSDQESQNITVIAISAVAAVTVTSILVVIALLLYRSKKRAPIAGNLNGVKQLLKGNQNSINPDLPLDEQTELLPYDKRWEFPRDRLKLGIQLGAGNFGRVVKAEAIGLNGEPVKTVAVKMVRSQTNTFALEALVSELKILIHLGAHVNIVNLLGACTKSLYKSDLLVIVEYCKFGNLQSYLINNRNGFINQLDEFGHFRSDCAQRTESQRRKDSEKNNEKCVKFTLDPVAGEADDTFPSSAVDPTPADGSSAQSQPVTTKDLLCWSFQVARGMEYLSSKKVLHGDVAARNILLGDDGVVKVADFGMARRMFYNVSYQKSTTGQGLLPIKWMSIESLTDGTFSTQSDVWSYGILLWELFSLAQMPYPGLEADNKLIRRLKDGYRMEKPPYAPQFIGELMAECWKHNPKERPTFRYLMESIGDQLDAEVKNHYVQLNERYIKKNMERSKCEAQSDYFSLMTRTVSVAQGFLMRSLNSFIGQSVTATTSSTSNLTSQQNLPDRYAFTIPLPPTELMESTKEMCEDEERGVA